MHTHSLIHKHNELYILVQMNHVTAEQHKIPENYFYHKQMMHSVIVSDE